MEFYNFHPDKIKLINMIPFGRASSIFMQGLLDGHPEIVTIVFYYLRKEESGGKNFENIVNLNYQRIKERINIYIGNYDLEKKIPKEKFAKYLKEYLNEFGISHKTVFIGVHYAYAKHSKKDIKKVRYIFAHSHWPDVFLDLAESFPKQKMMFLIRDPRASFLSGKRMKMLLASVLYLRNVMDLYKKIRKKNKDIIAIKHETLHVNYKKVKEVLIDWLDIKKHSSLDSATFLGKPFYGMDHPTVASPSGKSNIPSPKFVNENWKNELSTAEINFVQFFFSDIIEIFAYEKISKYEPLWVEYFFTRRNLSLNMIKNNYHGLRKISLKILRGMYMIPLIGRPMVKIVWIVKEVSEMIYENMKIKFRIRFM